MKLIFILPVFLVCSITLNAQNETSKWYFGEWAGINFSGFIPVALTDGALSTGEGCASISSQTGDLLFYTDGRFVYDKNHDQMPHGSGLFGHSSSTQSAIIVPKPWSTTQYYIFTLDAYDNGLVNGLCYSRVDMTLNGGLGDIVTSEKNISLLPYACEKVSAVSHSDGVSYWVVTHQWGSNAFYAFHVTSAGVSTTPVISYTGPALFGDMQASKGYMRISRDGSKLAMANNTAFSAGIYNFDNSLGVVVHLVTDNNFVNPGGADPGGPYGVEFSSDSQLLYVGEWKTNRKIYQYDLSSDTADDILDSRVEIATVGQNDDPIGALQMGPDNKIYVARRNSPYLSRIDQPDIQGTGCGFNDNAFSLAGRESYYGLPSFVQSYDFITEICIVSVTPEGHNEIIWEKTSTLSVDTVNIYRETAQPDVYEKIGKVPYEDSSRFTDLGCNPQQKPYKYKISTVSLSGNESVLSNSHTTIHLTINQDPPGWDLVWSPYEGFPVDRYYIYRGISPDSLNLLDSVSGNFTSYADSASPQGPLYYAIEIIREDGCNLASRELVDRSVSNIVFNGVVGLKENLESVVNLYPNPARELLYIEFMNAPATSGAELMIFDNQGKKIIAESLTTSKSTIDIRALNPGLYFIRLTYNNTTLIRKMVVF
jgi:hypothetical protein